ncbi:MAG: hypothetical protein WA717_07255 [Methyloceanibacter sp.]
MIAPSPLGLKVHPRDFQSIVKLVQKPCRVPLVGGHIGAQLPK